MKRGKRKSTRRVAREKLFNVKPSPERERDWSIRKAGFKKKQVGELPSRYTVYGNAGYSSWFAREVESQGQTGSCVGFAMASVLRYHLVMSGKATRSKSYHGKPSEQWLWQASKEMDQFTAHPSTMLMWDGTYLKTVLDVARKWGCVSRKTLPFGELIYEKTDKVLKAASDWKIKSYHAVSPWVEGESQFNEAGMKWWLFHHGPVLTRLNVNESFMKANKRTGVLDDTSKKTSYGHAVCVVGYSDDGVLIRNSWGRLWGDQGHVWVSWRYARLFLTESYGITMD